MLTKDREMTEIKTAQAWGWLGADGKLRDCWVAATHPDGEPVHFRGVIVYGLTEAEVHEAAALLEKSREVCEWTRDGFGILRDCAGESHSTNKHSNGAIVTFCPSCSRSVEVKE